MVPSAYVAAMQAALSPGRLHGYRAAPGDDDAILVARCLWSLSMAEALYPSLSLMEVALRNAVDGALSTTFGLTWISDPNVLDLSELTMVQKAEAELTTRGIANPTKDQILPELYFAFWVRLFFHRYGSPSQPQPGKQYLWPALILQVFPHVQGPAARRSSLLDRLQMIRYLRNRVSHHEPIWRGVLAPTSRHRSLVQAHRDILEAIGWLSPEVLATVMEIDRFPSVHATGLAPHQALVAKL